MDDVFLKVNKVLDEIRPYLQRDGGDIKLVSVQNRTAKVQFQGYCTMCNKSIMTLNSIKAIVVEKVPEIDEVIE